MWFTKNNFVQESLIWALACQPKQYWKKIPSFSLKIGYRLFIEVIYVVLAPEVGRNFVGFWEVLEKSYWNKILIFLQFLQKLLVAFFYIPWNKKVLLHTEPLLGPLGGVSGPPRELKISQDKLLTWGTKLAGVLIWFERKPISYYRLLYIYGSVHWKSATQKKFS